MIYCINAVQDDNVSSVFNGPSTCLRPYQTWPVVMPETLKNLEGHISFGSSVLACVRACVHVSYFWCLM